MRDRRNLIVAVLLVLFVILSFVIYIFNNNKGTVYIGDVTKLEIKKGKIAINKKQKKLNLTQAKIYFNGSFINGYLKSDKGDINNKAILYEAYNEDGVILRFTDDLLAYTGNVNIKVADINMLDIMADDDSTIVFDFFKSIGGGDNHSVDILDYKKIVYDLDNDGKLEYIYSVDILEEGTTDTSFVFICDGNEKKLINKKTGEIDNVDLKKVSFFNLIDLNEDNKYEIVIRVKNGEYGSNSYKIYNYDGNLKEIK